MIKRHALAFPAVLLAAAGPQLGLDDSVGLEGGSAPADGSPSLPVAVSDSTPEWGAPVRLSGQGAGFRSGRVRLLLDNGTGRLAQLASTWPSRSGRFAVSVRVRSSGRVVASQALAFPGSTTSGGTRLQLHPRLSVPAVIAAGRNGRTLVRSSVSPAGRWQWQLLRLRGRSQTAVASGLTPRTGIVVARTGVVSGDRLELRVAARPGFAAAVAAARVSRLRPAQASWYGDYGGGLACGGTLRYGTVGVAHRTLRCGTKVTISYKGRTIVAPVIDRGPFIAGREFDLSGAAARALRFDGVGTVWVSP